MQIKSLILIDYQGFATGEGSFQVDIKKNSNLKLGFQVLLRFNISQQARDEQ